MTALTATIHPAPLAPNPRFRVKAATEGGRVIGWAVIDMLRPDGAPMSQHWNHTDAVLAAEALNAEPYQPARRVVHGKERDVVIHAPSGIAILFADDEGTVARQADELNRLSQMERSR